MKTSDRGSFEMNEKLESHNVIAIFAVSALTLFVGILIKVYWL